MRTFLFVIILFIVVASGLGVWLFGRRAIHVGASSLIMGYWSFLVVNAYQHPTIITVFLGLITLYYFGAMFFSIIPSEVDVSWEGHFFGFLAGLGAAYLFPFTY